MDWHSDTHGSALVVIPTGPIDHQTSDEFEAKLLPEVDAAASAGGVLVINLERVDYMSSMGLRVLDRALKYAEESTVKIRVADLSAPMVEIFQISRFDKLIPVYDSVDAAVAG